jgi:hypothetical protein
MMEANKGQEMRHTTPNVAKTLARDVKEERKKRDIEVVWNG